MIDSHCHLADDAFVADRADVIRRARDAGVERALCVLDATNEIERQRADELTGEWPAVCYAIGVHPHQAGQFTGREEEVDSFVRAQIAERSGAVAVGEIGLDYHYDFSPRETQLRVFAEQIRLALELELPVVIHSRESDDDVLKLLAEEGQGRLSGVVHCFTGTAAVAARILDLGFYISLAGIVTFPKAEELRFAAQQIPQSRLLIETDSPYLAPVPFRGKRNEPAHVARVAEVLATTRRVPVDSLVETTSRNFSALFKLTSQQAYPSTMLRAPRA